MANATAITRNCQVVAVGPAVGQYRGRNIPEWILTGDDERFKYVGITGPMVDLTRFAADQMVIAPGLLYEKMRYFGPAEPVFGNKFVSIEFLSEYGSRAIASGMTPQDAIAAATAPARVAFIDAGYCIDAPNELPAGGCSADCSGEYENYSQIVAWRTDQDLQEYRIAMGKGGN